jgi:Xaa-Pro aminopeptidase
MKPGVKASDVDEAAKRCYQRIWIWRSFIHSTGHGVGLEIMKNIFITESDEKLKRDGNHC